jgi:hypothetical protein
MFKKRMVIIVTVLALGAILSFTACNKNKPVAGGPFTSADEFKQWLSEQPENNLETVYRVKLNVKDLGGRQWEEGSIANSLALNKFVHLDFSGSTFTSVGDGTFEVCYSLAGITLPKTVTSIGDRAFRNSNLLSMTIPNSVNSIGRDAFTQCRELTRVTISKKIYTISADAFSQCPKLTGITIPGRVTNIENNAFNGCASLISITIPKSVKNIGNCVFSDCNNLTAINVASGNSAYASQDGILYDKNKTVLIAYPGSKVGAFIIPSSVTAIADGAFSGCVGLTEITIPDGVTSIGSLAFCGTGITSVTIPNSVTSIGSGAFSWCNSLTSITLPNKLTSIEPHAFNGCESLKNIIIPNSVNSIGTGAFSGNLVSVTFQGTIPSGGFFDVPRFSDAIPAFSGDLRSKFYATDKAIGTPGTYVSTDGTWVKQGGGAANIYYATTNVRLRSEPDTSKDNRIAGVPKGGKVELLEVGKTDKIDNIKASWYKVKTVNGTIGWVFSGYLTSPAGLYDYTNILNGDFFDFTGTWINGKGYKEQLKKDGMFGGSWKRVLGIKYETNGSYYWFVEADGDAQQMWLYPVGIDIPNIQSDTTKVRLVSEGYSSSDDVYYREK